MYQFVLACEMIITDHCSSNYEIHIQELCHINVWQQAVVDPNHLVQIGPIYTTINPNKVIIILSHQLGVTREI